MPPRHEHQDIEQRIVRAADEIIRADGVKKLTMRRLAEEAGVALKTPYNVFGSKTGVLIALLNGAIAPLMEDIDRKGGHLVVDDLFAMLESTKQIFGADEDFFRGVFWEVMTSDHPEARAVAHGRITQVVIDRVAAAQAADEIVPEVAAAALGGQLGLNLLANMGSWAGGHLTIDGAMDHTKAVWASLLVGAVTPDVSGAVSNHLGTIQGVLGTSVE
ncbi:MAG: TetR/AcrR family transcriptional regulator [Pseudomonadota bacterium]